MTEFHPILSEKVLFRGRKLRKESTVPERCLWNAIRGGRLCGLKFRRQHAIGPFFADFYCHEQRLVIELDGQSHNDQGQYDLDREEYLAAQDLRIIRFTNDQVLFDLVSVVRAILIACGRDPETGVPLDSKGRTSSKPPSKTQRPVPHR
jgi:very-short-patch-repair endonuclease